MTQTENYPIVGITVYGIWKEVELIHTDIAANGSEFYHVRFDDGSIEVVEDIDRLESYD
jgi:hypothetical protein